jgi:hypothetical protein
MKIATVEDEARNLPAVVVGRDVTHAEEREKAVLGKISLNRVL